MFVYQPSYTVRFWRLFIQFVSLGFPIAWFQSSIQIDTWTHKFYNKKPNRTRLLKRNNKQCCMTRTHRKYYDWIWWYDANGRLACDSVAHALISKQKYFLTFLRNRMRKSIYKYNRVKIDGIAFLPSFNKQKKII